MDGTKQGEEAKTWPAPHLTQVWALSPQILVGPNPKKPQNGTHPYRCQFW